MISKLLLLLFLEKPLVNIIYIAEGFKKNGSGLHK